MEMTYGERIFCTYRLIATGGIACQAEPHGETPGSSRGRGSEGKSVQEPFLSFLLEGMSQAEQVGLRSPSFNNLSGLWGTGAVPSCLALGCLRQENTFWIGGFAYERHVAS